MVDVHTNRSMVLQALKVKLHRDIVACPHGGYLDV